MEEEVGMKEGKTSTGEEGTSEESRGISIENNNQSQHHFIISLPLN